MPADLAAIQARGITKVYPGTVALRQVDFTAYAGAVNVLMGENGAGKSTLMRILAGVEMPDAGEITIGGERVELHTPAAAERHGVAIVHQELNLMPNMTIAENIFAGHELCRGGFWVDGAEQNRQAQKLLAKLSLDVDVQTVLGTLPIGQQQLVEIARALGKNARVLILDEPTSALSHAEIPIFFGVLRELRNDGVAIVYVSHRLKELLEIGDFITVLRDGRLVASASRGEVTESWIVERMTGRPAQELSVADRSSVDEQEKVLSVEALTLRQGNGNPLDSVSFQIRKGEIVGVYGLLGAGRTELMEALVGLRGATSGTVDLDGASIDQLATPDRLNAGIRLLPEDRQADGLIPQMSIRGNASLSFLQRLQKWGWLSHDQEREAADAVLAQMRVKSANFDDPVTTLSGGNQQKALLARVLLTQPKVILLDEPTRGVDVGGKSEIYSLIRKLATDGVGILFTSSDAQEIRELATRVLVLSRGRVSADLDVRETNEESLLLLADATCQN